MKKIALNSILSILFLMLFTLCYGKEESGRSIQNFGKDWKFQLGDTPGAEAIGFDDASWRSLNVPHDWSIEGSFAKENPATAGGGALPGGVGWYRKTFEVTAKALKGAVFIDFDGVYQNSEVWINGHSLGKRFYGYSSFRYNLTPFLNAGKNTVAVRVDNSQQPNSRWYSGSGIYRNVWLVSTGKTYIDHWGTFVTTPSISEDAAQVSVSTQIRTDGIQPKEVTLKTEIKDPSGKVIAAATTKPGSFADNTNVSKVELQVKNPILWDLDSPKLYTVESSVFVDDKLVDNYSTPFGIRSFSFDPQKGFFLNGKFVKINGVCNHHDLGCLGAAINTRALERQIEILKEMGCNAIRTSHNPPAPELLDLADRMGMIIMDEAFDIWEKQKNKFDYHLVWSQDRKKDLQDLIRRDRNHPSVMIWSIGNEIQEQWDASGTAKAKELADLIHELDTTRPITSALNDPQPRNNIYKSGALDLVGFNYHHQDFEAFPRNFPGQKFIATETVSGLMTRGHYDMPADSIRRWPVRWDLPFTGGNPDNSVSAYDNVSAPWGSTHEETWKVIKNNDFLSGQFIWTGFDYLGEPTPYDWPSRSSYFGIIDLAGFPKDIYYMYQSEWTNKNVLHIFPHWNWQAGKTVDLKAYTNADEVELFLNGKSLGTKKKQGDDLHLMWRVPYSPGTLKAIARKGGKEVNVQEIKTAGKAYKLVLTADRKEIKGDGNDLSFITVDVVDEKGTVVPDAANLVNFRIEGPGLIAGVDNGDPVSHDSFKAPMRKAFNGKCLVVVQSAGKSGDIKITATADGLKDASVAVRAK